MPCDDCSFMCARTTEQLMARLRNISAHPNVEVYTCPVCGGQDWATSTEFVIAAKDKPPATVIPALIELALALGIAFVIFALAATWVRGL